MDFQQKLRYKVCQNTVHLVCKNPLWMLQGIIPRIKNVNYKFSNWKHHIPTTYRENNGGHRSYYQRPESLSHLISESWAYLWKDSGEVRNGFLLIIPTSITCQPSKPNLMCWSYQALSLAIDGVLITLSGNAFHNPWGQASFPELDLLRKYPTSNFSMSN